MNNTLQNQINMNTLECAKNACEGVAFPTWGWWFIGGIALALISTVIIGFIYFRNN